MEFAHDTDDSPSVLIILCLNPFRTKPAMHLCSLSLDELCDQVTSFEHGKVCNFTIVCVCGGGGKGVAL